MKVTLRPITPENFRPVVQLKVGPGQEHFVATNVYSLAQAKVWPSYVPLAIYADETPVGFLMHGPDEAGQRWIIRLMVDAEHQRQGHGRAAMRLILAEFRADPACGSVAISYEPANQVAADLYRELGFVETGEMEDGELVARLNLAGPAQP